MEVRISVIGAGLGGLSAAYHAERAGLDYRLYEKADHVGGLCSTVRKGGYLFDYTGHFLHLKDPYFQNLVREALGENLRVVRRNSFIFSNGVFTRYPFQSNLYGLPPEVARECLLEFVKAYFTKEDLPTSRYENFHEWIECKFGLGIGKYFMFPYNRKIWTVPTEELTCDWLGEYVPRPSLEQVFEGTFTDTSQAVGYNVTFLYPEDGGIQALAKGLAATCKGLRLGAEVTEVEIGDKVVRLASGEEAPYHHLISTMPLKTLVERLRGPVPKEVRDAGAVLRHNSLLAVNLGVRGSDITDKHWVYIPEEKYLIYRLGVYSNIAPAMAPEGCTSYYAEVAYHPGKPFHKEIAVERVTDELIEMGFIPSRGDIEVREAMDIGCAYVIYDQNRAQAVQTIRSFLSSKDIKSVGRYGAWEYSGMEEALAQGRDAIAEIALQA